MGGKWGIHKPLGLRFESGRRHRSYHDLGRGRHPALFRFSHERIQDAVRDFNIGKMAQSDWQAMYETSHNIENKMLRYIFQLKMREAVINQTSRGARKVE